MEKGRLDWIVNSKTQIFVRYAIKNKNEFGTTSQPYSSSLDVPLSGHNQSIVLNLIHISSPHLAAESRFVFNRVTGDPDRLGGISVNGPFTGTLPRNNCRQPGTYYQDTALLKNFPLPREGMQLQFRAEFYNLFNHPNLYVNCGTNEINSQGFNKKDGLTVPGVTTAFRDNRQIVLALKFIF